MACVLTCGRFSLAVRFQQLDHRRAHRFPNVHISLRVTAVDEPPRNAFWFGLLVFLVQGLWFVHRSFCPPSTDTDRDFDVGTEATHDDVAIACSASLDTFVG